MIKKLLLDFDRLPWRRVKEKISCGVEVLGLDVRRVRVEDRGPMYHHVTINVDAGPVDRPSIIFCQLVLGSDPEREAMLESRANSPDCFPGDSWNEFWLSKNGEKYKFNRERTIELRRELRG